MRFAKLMLERYGRFENCELDFTRRGPDLHVIYGPNEAGKSTSLSAVSDLLFGFPMRSPYNFLFDYSLLRVGAVLEEDDRKLACRRRKSGAVTLIDAEDQPIPDGDLRAMLRGQTRETFRLSFSLDQEALREGGKAMVKAKDDVGQALFAAGSGLTGISEQLKQLEHEADAIWGRRPKTTRTYRQAELELEASLKKMRDASLKPKAWIEAKRASDDAKQRIDALEDQRRSLLQENQQLQRARRVAGNVRLRQELIETISEATQSTEMTEALEVAALAAMAEVEVAARAKSVAEHLLEELNERAGSLNPEQEVLEEAAAIDTLISELGSVTKAAKDLVRLEAERALAVIEASRLRGLARIADGEMLSAEIVVQLRDISRERATDVAALEEIAATRAELDVRRKRLEAILKEDVEAEEHQSLLDAFDAAQRLGSDVDERCIAARRAANEAAVEREQRLARLRPWEGNIEQLAALPSIGELELESARATWLRHRDEIEGEDATAVRLESEVERLDLEIERAGTGAAISEQEVLSSRSIRDAHWTPLRDYLLGKTELLNTSDEVVSFEQAVQASDGIADRRFALAEESAHLAGLEAARSERQLEARQAHRRAVSAKEHYEGASTQWRQRLLSLGLPDLAPVQLASWLGERDAALSAHTSFLRLEAEAVRLEERRAVALAALWTALTEPAEGCVEEIAPVLARAQRKCEEIEAQAERFRSARDGLDQVEVDLAGLERRASAATNRANDRQFQWEQLLAGSGIQLELALGADARLTAIDELRRAEEAVAGLEQRLEGIRRDAAEFKKDLSAVAGRLGITIEDEAQTVAALQDRLTAARSAQAVIAGMDKDHATRQSEIDAAVAGIAAAMQTLEPLLQRTETDTLEALAEAIQGSRALRAMRESLVTAEEAIIRDGDGAPLEDLVAMVVDKSPDDLAARSVEIERELAELNQLASDAATAHGEATRAFDVVERETGAAPGAAFAAEQAKAEMSVLAERYILKRTQAVTLRWAIEKYRERNQDPLLIRASELFSALTLNRYSALRVELDDGAPRLLGITDHGRAAVEVDTMSEGTTDQLFLALRLAAVEQSVEAGVCLPFLADDLFVNFDDDRAEAGFRVLAELAEKTQVLFFTHHLHLADIAKRVVGEESYSECALV